jgi:hypothetical protein
MCVRLYDHSTNPNNSSFLKQRASPNPQNRTKKLSDIDKKKLWLEILSHNNMQNQLCILILFHINNK